MNDKLYKANETQIYDLTGCLSACHKYYYDVQPMTDLKVVIIDHAQVKECELYADSVFLHYLNEYYKSLQVVGSFHFSKIPSQLMEETAYAV